MKHVLESKHIEDTLVGKVMIGLVLSIVPTVIVCGLLLGMNEECGWGLGGLILGISIGYIVVASGVFGVMFMIGLSRWE